MNDQKDVQMNEISQKYQLLYDAIESQYEQYQSKILTNMLTIIDNIHCAICSIFLCLTSVETFQHISSDFSLLTFSLYYAM